MNHPLPRKGRHTPYPLQPMAKFNDIQLLRINYLRGPNIFTYRPVLEV